MSMCKLCFIGAGRHASMNLYPSAKVCEANIVAVATRSLSSAQAAVARLGLPTTMPYGDYRAMLREVPCDGVVIAADAQSQYDFALEAIRAQKNVLVEKPLGLTAEQAQNIAKQADLHGVTAMVAFMKRYAPACRKLKESVDTQIIGRPLSFHAVMAVDCSFFADTDELMLKFAMIHYLDLVRDLFGQVVAVRGFRNTVDANTNLCFSLQFESGVCGTLYFSGSRAWTRHEESFTVTGEKGFARVYDFSKFALYRHEETNAIRWQTLSECDSVYAPTSSTSSGGLRDLYINGFVGEMQHFISCVQNKQIPETNLWDNVKTMQLCESVLAACQT